MRLLVTVVSPATRQSAIVLGATGVAVRLLVLAMPMAPRAASTSIDPRARVCDCDR